MFKRITKQQAQEIIDKFMSGISKTQLSIEYKIGKTTIWSILHGVVWKTCKRPDNIQELINAQRSLRSGSMCKELPILTELQNDILIGSLLGDGYISKMKGHGNSYFNKLQVHTKKSYLDWHFQAFSKYSRKLYSVFCKEKLFIKNDGKIGRVVAPVHLSAYSFYTFRHPNFTTLRNIWYLDGVKKVPLDLELNLQRIAIWFFDDGTNSFKKRYASIATNAFTIEEVEFLSQKLNKFNLYPTITTQISKYTDKKMPILGFYGSSYDNLIDMIKPYMLWNCFEHKIQWRPSKKQIEYVNHI